MSLGIVLSPMTLLLGWKSCTCVMQHKPSLMPGQEILEMHIEHCPCRIDIGSLAFEAPYNSDMFRGYPERDLRCSDCVAGIRTSLRYASPRWVFCKSNHWPSDVAADKYFRAITSCPWPIETPRVLILFLLARSSICFVGSAPGKAWVKMSCRMPIELAMVNKCEAW